MICSWPEHVWEGYYHHFYILANNPTLISPKQVNGFVHDSFHIKTWQFWLYFFLARMLIICNSANCIFRMFEWIICYLTFKTYNKVGTESTLLSQIDFYLKRFRISSFLFPYNLLHSGLNREINTLVNFCI
jgi:hypothetical protein